MRTLVESSRPSDKWPAVISGIFWNWLSLQYKTCFISQLFKKFIKSRRWLGYSTENARFIWQTLPISKNPGSKFKFSKVRVGNMAATLVLKVDSEGVFESDLRSVWIFELGQKLTEMATFTLFFQEGRDFWRKRSNFDSHIGRSMSRRRKERGKNLAKRLICNEKNRK